MTKRGNRTIQFTIFTLLTLTLILIFSPNQTTSAQKSRKQFQKNQKQSTRVLSGNKTGGAEKQKQIPDKVAYELFLRTLGENNASALLEKGKFTEREFGVIMSTANLFNVRYAGLSKTALTAKSRRDEYLAETLDDLLPRRLREDGMNKLQSFIDTQVKPKIQAVSNDNSSKRGTKVSPGTTSDTPPTYSGGGQLYLYSAAWQDDLNVYGLGTISEQYASNTSYQVTVTVTSESGRSNTTTGDWSNATVINTTGLSIGVEVGTYNVQANFEQQDGYYDSYGNFNGNGSSSVGSSTSSTTVAPSIMLVNAYVTPNQFYLGVSPTEDKEPALSVLD